MLTNAERRRFPGRILPGQIWQEVETGRRIKILQEEVYGTGPSWTYVDANDKSELDGPAHPDWYWHYCDVFDFVVWGRFRYLR